MFYEKRNAKEENIPDMFGKYLLNHINEKKLKYQSKSI